MANQSETSDTPPAGGPRRPASPPATPNAPGPAPAASGKGKGPGGSNKGGDGGNPQESAITRAILRRQLATPEEVEACRAQRAKLAPPENASPRKLLELLIQSRAITQAQALRLLRESAPEAQRKMNIPGYEILSELGRGSMGMVYKARQVSVDRVVALKVILDSLTNDPDYVKRFQREATVAARLSHANIVNVYDAGESDGRHYFVMEYVEGSTVKDELEKRKGFTEEQALRIVVAIARALKHADEKGLVHRDVKPDNIILTKTGEVKLADLGLARPVDDQAQAVAEAGLAIGTPYYISPEQVRGRKDIDIRADIYSLGATLYHMMTGRVPFEGKDPVEVMRQHITRDPDPPDHVNPRISSGLASVIEMMMARDREARYRNPDDLLLDLESLVKGEPPRIADAGRSSALDMLARAEADAEGQIQPGAVAQEELDRLRASNDAKFAVIAVLGIVAFLSVALNLVLLMR